MSTNNASVDIPDRRWLRVDEVGEILIALGVIPLFEVEYEGGTCLTVDTLEPMGKFLGDAAFAGTLKIMGCRAAPSCNGFGELVPIPDVYFRKPRAWYWRAGISRLSWEPTPEEIAQDAEAQRLGNPEPDWTDALISRDDFVKLIANYGPSKSGSPGRPTSMHLVAFEFEDRRRLGKLAPTMVAESEFLSVWLRKNYPLEPQLTPKAIRNNLAGKHREAQAKPNGGSVNAAAAARN